MAKKTGWDALPMKYHKVDPNNDESFIPKRVLVQHGLWEEIVEMTMLSGLDDDQTRESLEEYGCTEDEIEGYFEQYNHAEPLTMVATAGA